MAAGSDTELTTERNRAATWIGGITGALGAITYAIAIGGGTAGFACPGIFAAMFFMGWGVDRARDNCTRTEEEHESTAIALTTAHHTPHTTAITMGNPQSLLKSTTPANENTPLLHKKTPLNVNQHVKMTPFQRRILTPS